MRELKLQKPTIRRAAVGDREMIAGLYTRETSMFKNRHFASAWFAGQFSIHFEQYRLKQVVLYALQDNSTVKRCIRGHAEAMCIGGTESGDLTWKVLGLCIEGGLNPQLVEAFIAYFLIGGCLSGEFMVSHASSSFEFEVVPGSELHLILTQKFDAQVVGAIARKGISSQGHFEQVEVLCVDRQVGCDKLGITNLINPYIFDGPLKIL